MPVAFTLFRHKPFEEITQIESDIRIGILLDDQRAGSVLNEYSQQPVRHPLLCQPFLYGFREGIQSFAARLDGECSIGELQIRLFYGDALSQVPRLIDVAAPAYSNVIGKQLQRNHLEQRQE